MTRRISLVAACCSNASARRFAGWRSLAWIIHEGRKRRATEPLRGAIKAVTRRFRTPRRGGSMATDCIAQVTFEFDPKRKPVVAVFDAAHASSDGGAILLKGIDTQLGLTKGLAACLADPRQPGKVQLERLMLDLARLPLVLETRGQPLGQPELGIDPLEQDGAAVGAGVLRVEDGDYRLPFRIEFERDLRYTVCSHRASSSWSAEASCHRFYRTPEGLGGSSLSSFVNYPG